MCLKGAHLKVREVTDLFSTKNIDINIIFIEIIT